MPVTITVEGTPAAKGRGRMGIINGRPSVLTPTKTRNYETRIKQMARIAMIGKPRLTGAVCMRLKIFLIPPISWSKKKRANAVQDVIRPSVRPDLDNYAKAALDGCNTIVFKDDAQITDLIVTKRYRHEASLVIIADEVERVLP